MWTRLRAVALAAIEEFDPDVAVIGHDMSMAWSDDLPAGLPAVLTCHNLLWNWYESRARRTSGPAAAVLRAEAWRYRRFVRSRLGRFHAAVALSTIERDQLIEMGGPRVSLIPMGVDVGSFRPTPEQDGPAARALHRDHELPAEQPGCTLARGAGMAAGAPAGCPTPGWTSSAATRVPH